MDPLIAGGLGFAALIAFWILLAIFRAFVVICRPNEFLVISGAKRKLADGREIGFRTENAGWVLRRPIVQKIDAMDITLMPIPIETRNAYSKGGIPLTVQAVAMVRISTDPRFVNNAVERFLGKPRGYLQQVSRETLEGHLRGVLATLTPEEVNEDRLKFAANLQQEAEEDFQKLGLHLDTLKLQHIADDANYLASLGRTQIANVLRDAELAESNCKASADQSAASADASGKVAKEKAAQAILQKQNELRRVKAELDATIQSENERAEAAAEEAQAVAERELQGVRANLEKIRLEADVEIPADMQRAAAEQLAAGNAAKIQEDGRARAEVLAWMNAVWRKAGPQASEIFLLRQLDDVLNPIVAAVKKVEVADSAVVDDGTGKNFAALVASRPQAVLELLARLEALTGLDLTLGGDAPPAPAVGDGGAAARPRIPSTTTGGGAR